MNKRQLRVVWMSNAPWSPSGYGQQTWDIERQFVKSGWTGENFALINMFGQGGGTFVDQLGITNYPSVNHAFGSDALVQHSQRFRADVAFTLLDLWPQNPMDLQQVNRIIPWAPIDYDPVPQPITANLRLAHRIISMSKYGEKALRENGFSSTYIPHHVDTKIFYPIDKAKRKIEQRIDPNTFLFGMVAANKDIMPRKSFQQVLDAFAGFLKNHPNSLLYIHTDPDQPGGFPVRQYANFLGIANNVGFPDLYKWKFDTSKEEMNRIYNTFDAYLAPSSSEGFCIPIIEAQATGTPVIVNNWTSMPELVIDGKTGLITKQGCKHFFPIGSYMCWPDTQDLYQKMEQLFTMPRPMMGQMARKFVEDNYSLDKLWKEKWLVLLNELEEEIYGKIDKSS